MFPAFLVTAESETLVLRLCERLGPRLMMPVVLFFMPSMLTLGTLSEDLRFGVEMKRSLLLLSVPGDIQTDSRSLTTSADA